MTGLPSWLSWPLGRRSQWAPVAAVLAPQFLHLAPAQPPSLPCLLPWTLIAATQAAKWDHAGSGASLGQWRERRGGANLVLFANDCTTFLAPQKRNFLGNTMEMTYKQDPWNSRLIIPLTITNTGGGACYYVRHWTKCITCSTSFSSYNSLPMLVLLVFPFCRWGDWAQRSDIFLSSYNMYLVDLAFFFLKTH